MGYCCNSLGDCATTIKNDSQLFDICDSKVVKYFSESDSWISSINCKVLEAIILFISIVAICIVTTIVLSKIISKFRESILATRVERTSITGILGRDFVYVFFLGTKKIGWIVALLSWALQIVIYFVF